jgi:hypothetical protein
MLCVQARKQVRRTFLAIVCQAKNRMATGVAKHVSKTTAASAAKIVAALMGRLVGFPRGNLQLRQSA